MENQKRKLGSTVIIPAYEPDGKMNELVRALRRHGLHVVVIDDGSGESCQPLFESVSELGATVLRHDANRGKGRAIKTALEYLIAHDCSNDAVIADADGQHAVNDILRVAQAQRDHSLSVILGVRPIERMPFRSKLGNVAAKRLFQLRTGLEISDTQTGLRGIPSFLFSEMAALPGERYEYEMNMLLLLKRANISFVEIPVDAIYIDDNRSSHFRPLRDTARILWQFLTYSAASMLCAAAEYLLYTLFLGIGLSTPFSYGGSRLFSAAMNFSLNRASVFHIGFRIGSAVKYALLVFINIGVGSLGTSMLMTAGMHGVFAKMLVDTALFVSNYFIQKKLIFV